MTSTARRLTVAPGSIVVGRDESNLEVHFRVAFFELLKGLNATVTESPGPQGNIVHATLGGVQWKLEPQVPMAGCEPDFVLSSSLPVAQVAIFTDGYAFHASPAINRIADDAVKRATLRGLGLEVLGITWTDVQRYLDHKKVPQPSWYTPQLAQMFMPRYDYNAAALKTLLDGPFAWLAAWIQDPESLPMQQLALALPMLFIGGPAPFQLNNSQDLGEVAVDLLVNGTPPTDGGDQASWWWQSGSVGALVRVRGVSHIDVALVLDDRDEAVAGPEFPSHWQEWLRISNALALRPNSVHTEIVAVRSLAKPAQPLAPLVVELSSSWAHAVELVYGKEAIDLARALAAAGVEAPDLLGEEMGAGVPVDFAWSSERVAVLIGRSAADVDDIQAEGWTVVEADVDAVKAALAAGGI